MLCQTCTQDGKIGSRIDWILKYSFTLRPTEGQAVNTFELDLVSFIILTDRIMGAYGLAILV